LTPLKYNRDTRLQHPIATTLLQQGQGATVSGRRCVRIKSAHPLFTLLLP
jgi:hypothetical protein